MADAPVLQVQLDVINQEIEYNGTPKTIPETNSKRLVSPSALKDNLKRMVDIINPVFLISCEYLSVY